MRVPGAADNVRWWHSHKRMELARDPSLEGKFVVVAERKVQESTASIEEATRLAAKHPHPAVMSVGADYSGPVGEVAQLF